MLDKAKETAGQLLLPIARRLVSPLLTSSLGDQVGAVRIGKRFARQWAASAGLFEHANEEAVAEAPAAPEVETPGEIVPAGEQEPVRVYTSRRHSSCKTAKGILDELGIAFEELDVTDDEGARRKLLDETGDKTFPQIYVGAKRLGGFDDLVVARDDGKLQGLLYPTDHPA